MMEIKRECLLDGVNSPEDIKKLDAGQLAKLSEEIREFLIEKVSRTGGHLASNLGVVELTLSLHRVFDSPRDRIIWDVGHQSYVHKIITGRKETFDTLRQQDGLAGFPKTAESEHDCFNTGHSSTSISAALGMAKARDILNEKYSVVAVIGDGAMTGGMSFEALNDAGRSPNNLIVILNDNQMSISKNVGSLSSYLSKIRTQPIYYKAKEDFDLILNRIPAIGKSAAKALNRAKGTIKYMIMPGVIFEELGFKYLGPIDGHNISELIKVFSRARNLKGPVLIHVCTQKGRGYSFAEEKPQDFHGISPFEIETGEVLINNGPTYSDIFGAKMAGLAEKDPRIAAITAAMPLGTGLGEFSKKFPERFFDVGIAEQHAVTFAAGLAKSGLKPVVAVYSTFLQRSYDQIIHDIALQNLHVVFAVDRAGLVGEDGETHQGLYDLSFLSHIPNMAIAAPCDYDEFEKLLEYALLEYRGPIAIRYPRGAGRRNLGGTGAVTHGRGVRLTEGGDLTIAAVGNMVETAMTVAAQLKEMGVSTEVINARFIKPLDAKLIAASAVKTGVLATLEDNTVKGGFGSGVLEMLSKSRVNVRTGLFGFPDAPVFQGSRADIFRKYRLDPASLTADMLKLLRHG